MNDNEITILENLENCTSLTNLSVGNNQVAEFGTALSKLHLNTLNMAGNRINSFVEIHNLSHLPLKILKLNDENYGTNRICSLSNYTAHMIQNLSALELLDSLVVTSESRKIIRDTITSKNMYYNMRVSTIKRNKGCVMSHIDKQLSNCWYAVNAQNCEILTGLKKMEKMVYDIQICDTKGTFGRQREFTDTFETIRGYINENNCIAAENAENQEIFKKEVDQQCDYAVRKLLLELETGGNIRLENDDVSQTFAEVVRRFMATNTKIDQRIRINRVSRIHNHFLTLNHGKRHTRDSIYLSYQSPNNNTNDIFQILENQKNAKEGIFLSDKLNYSEAKQSTAILFRANLRKTALYTDENLCDVKCFDYPTYDAVYQNSKSSASLKYLVFPNADPVPEYLVEYTNLGNPSYGPNSYLMDLVFSSRFSEANFPSLIATGTVNNQSPPKLKYSYKYIEHRFPMIMESKLLANYAKDFVQIYVLTIG